MELWHRHPAHPLTFSLCSVSLNRQLSSWFKRHFFVRVDGGACYRSCVRTNEWISLIWTGLQRVCYCFATALGVHSPYSVHCHESGAFFFNTASDTHKIQINLMPTLSAQSAKRDRNEWVAARTHNFSSSKVIRKMQMNVIKPIVRYCAHLQFKFRLSRARAIVRARPVTMSSHRFNSSYSILFSIHFGRRCRVFNSIGSFYKPDCSPWSRFNASVVRNLPCFACTRSGSWSCEWIDFQFRNPMHSSIDSLIDHSPSPGWTLE